MIQQALILGFERIAAWSGLLDEINVFPVADGDTGRNLVVSLSPLRQLDTHREETVHRLLMSARGNSGNIAARFFSEFIHADSMDAIPEAARSGRDAAWQAVHDPVPGTMLTIFDEMAEALGKDGVRLDDPSVTELVSHLERTVRSTPELLPRLRTAGVVDSGALGMYIFFEGFFVSLSNKAAQFQPVTTTFKDMLKVSAAFNEDLEEGYCVDTVVQLAARGQGGISSLSGNLESMLVIPHDDFLKVHFHTIDREKVRKEIEALGDIVAWSDDNLGTQVARFRNQKTSRCIHIMTDAAGSVTREDSDTHDMTLLDSYITVGERSLPETLFSPSELYKRMREGIKVSTSQASIFERHQHYQSVLNQHDRVLYLCVGAVYTGNYDVIMGWKQTNDPDDRLTVIDTTAASGRLGTIALLTSRFSTRATDPHAVIEFANRAVGACEEYVFLDRLQYLAAGGRLSKTSAFFGDMLHMKPIISPTAEGAKKVGVVRDQNDQLQFALRKLDASIRKGSKAFIMLQYSDNRSWVEETVMEEIKTRYPFAEIMLRPLSLTSGAHMGPGTWAVAFLPWDAMAMDKG
ncbi:MAG: DegV family EDD domain-containing protein [Deltaproteobacteria bacterium]|nr:DegV family EDD domain-containing protein [Deltaproteobacteria bacterium]